MRLLLIILFLPFVTYSQKVIRQSTVIGLEDSLAAKANKSDSVTFQTKFRSDTGRVNTYTSLAGKVTSVSGTANRITSTGGITPVIDISATFEGLLLKKTDSTIYQPLFRSDTGRVNTYTSLAGKVTLVNDDTARTNLYTSLAAKAPLASPALTGVPVAPTAAAGTNTTQIATTAYVMAAGVFTLAFDPVLLGTVVDTAIYYYGANGGAGLGTTAAQKQIKLLYNCTLIGWSIAVRNSITASAEASSLYIRVNNATDLLLSNAITFINGAAAVTFSATGLSTDYTANDLIELKLACRTWVTNPTNMGVSTILYFRLR